MPCSICISQLPTALKTLDCVQCDIFNFYPQVTFIILPKENLYLLCRQGLSNRDYWNGWWTHCPPLTSCPVPVSPYLLSILWVLHVPLYLRTVLPDSLCGMFNYRDLCTTGFSWASCLWSQPPIPVSKASQFPLPTYLLSLCCLALSATRFAPFKLQQNIWRFLIHLFACTLMTSSHRNMNFTVHFDFVPSGSEISHSNQQVFLKVYTNLHVCLNSKRQEVTVQSKRHSFVWTL